MRFEPLPRFPAVAADMTIEHAADLAFAELVGAVRELAGELVETVDLQARYTGAESAPTTRCGPPCGWSIATPSGR